MNTMTTAALFASMTDLRDQQLAWLDNITASTGLTLTDVARRSRLDPSTLTRFRSKNEGGHTLTAKTIKKIEDSTGIPAYEVRLRRPTLASFHEEEAEPYKIDDKAQDLLVEALRAIVSRSNSVDLWMMKSDVLSAAGYRDGDILVVDRDATPKVGDAVCAQRYDWRRGTAETIFRIYRTPYLLTAIAQGEPGIPEIVDDENIVIKGVIVGGCHLRN